VFLEPDSERCSGLPGVLHAACGASQLVYSTIFVFIPVTLLFGCQMSSYGVICAEGDFDTCVLEYLRDGSCLSTCVCELDPLRFFFYALCFLLMSIAPRTDLSYLLLLRICIIVSRSFRMFSGVSWYEISLFHSMLALVNIHNYDSD
jgi:hypothetical protein